MGKINKNNFILTFDGSFIGDHFDFSKFETMESWGDPVTHSQIKDSNSVIYIIWKPSQVRVIDRLCNLVTEKNDVSSEPHTKSGMITTFRSLNQLYGYFECKMKVPSGGVYRGWPAFWAWSIGDSNNPSMECDIAEFTEPTSAEFTSTIHRWGNTHEQLITNKSHGDLIKYTFSEKIKNWINRLFTGKTIPKYIDLSNDFHIYGLEWNKNEMKFYLDDVLQYSFPNYINRPLYFIINNGIRYGYMPDGSFYPINMHVEYFKAFKYK